MQLAARGLFEHRDNPTTKTRTRGSHHLVFPRHHPRTLPPSATSRLYSARGARCNMLLRGNDVGLSMQDRLAIHVPQAPLRCTRSNCEICQRRPQATGPVHCPEYRASSKILCMALNRMFCHAGSAEEKRFIDVRGQYKMHHAPASHATSRVYRRPNSTDRIDFHSSRLQREVPVSEQGPRNAHPLRMTE